MSTEVEKQEKPAVETIRVKVDGKEIDVPKMSPDWQGNMRPTTMLEACQQAGVDVPHYCYHHKLPVAGNCRMCLVHYGMQALGPDRKPVVNEDGSPKIAKQALPYEPTTPRGAIACATPIAPNMEIYASSEETKQMREGVLESLLINHPLDCPICDQAGECKLQEYSFEHGQGESRFVETKVHKPKQVDLGPRIMLDDERCILCSRCVRFSKDIAGDDALGFVNRGSYNTLAAAPGREVDNDYTLNTVDLCPVGALTSKDFRFQMRVWFLKESKGVCGSCATGCNTVVGSREGTIYRMEPRENDEVNSSWMCDHGRLNFKWVADENRVAHSTVKRGDVREVVQPAAAIEEIAKALSGIENGSLAIVASGALSTEEYFLLKLLAGRFGALSDVVPHTGKGDSLLISEDKNPNNTGAQLVGFIGASAGSQLEQIHNDVRSGKITSLLFLGEDPLSAGYTVEELEKLSNLFLFSFAESESTATASVVLSACAYFEKRGTFVNRNGRIQKFMKAVDGPGSTEPELESLLFLLEKLGEKTHGKSIEGVFNWMSDETEGLKKVRWAGIGDLGIALR